MILCFMMYLWIIWPPACNLFETDCGHGWTIVTDTTCDMVNMQRYDPTSI